MNKPRLTRPWLWFARIGYIIILLFCIFDSSQSQVIRAAQAAVLGVFFILMCLD